MIAACILLMSVGALAQFASSYCRALLLTYAKVNLSPLTLEVTGHSQGIWEPYEFHQVMALARLASDLRDDILEIRAITAYYKLVEIAERILAVFSRAGRDWARQELSQCVYFAAVTLDRRLLSSTP